MFLYLLGGLLILMELDKSQQFHVNLIRGQIGKEVARALLEKAGYKAYSFGYESLLTQLRYDVKKRTRVPLTDSNNRLRSTPDLMVHDDEKRETYFVEIKSSTPDNRMRVRLNLRPLRWYKKYWNDSILVLAAPKQHVFYAQRISLLDISDNPEYRTWWFDIEKQFAPIESIFSKVSPELMRSFYPVLEKFQALEQLDGEDAEVEE